mgnify:CR=1 FL=1
MKEIDEKFKKNLLLGTLLIAIYFILSNLGYFLKGFRIFIQIINPFLAAFAIAFVLNIPMTFFETKVFSFLETKKYIKYRNFKRPLSILTTFITVIGLITALALFVIPQLTSSVSTLLKTIPGYMSSFERLISQYISDSEISKELLQKVSSTIMTAWKDLFTVGGEIISNSLSSILNTTLNITSGLINFILSIILSVYMLSSKETLIYQIKKLLYAFLDEKTADKLIYIGKISNLTFSKFISGQCVEAVILGGLCFIGMILLRMPYALLISVLIAVTALIPVFGAFIGTIPAVFLILLISPIKALWFIIFILFLQQFEGNIIYPKVVGNSVGLSALWVMMAMLVGGSSLGILGMLIGIPIFSVLYQLLKDKTNKKLKTKEIEIK